MKPDVVYFQDVSYFDSAFVGSLGGDVRFVVGQAAYPLEWDYGYGVYDLVVSSFPHYVAAFRGLGVQSEYLKIGFEPRVLSSIPQLPRDLDSSFVGSFSSHHDANLPLLEAVARETPTLFWGSGVARLGCDSPVRDRYKGEAWGLDMYALLSRSRVALNRHGGVSGRYANNMRLYEATGVGACLVTDIKANLGELFEIDREIVAYTGAADCIEKMLYLVEHETERAAIAKAGQLRTLRSHTYAHRMEELDSILKDQMRKPRMRPASIVRPPLPSGWRISHLTKKCRTTFAASPAGPVIRRGLRYLRTRGKKSPSISGEYHLISPDSLAGVLVSGWQDKDIPKRQSRVVDEELARMYAGRTPDVFRAAAEALNSAGIGEGSIVEIGCASGYYSEVFAYLLDEDVDYLGIDYSAPMIQEARRRYRDLRLVIADASALPLPDSSYDIAFSAGVILHLADYKSAVAECARVSRRSCIFHRTPVTAGPKSVLSKEAYGVPVVELVFNEAEILGVFFEVGLRVTSVLSLGTYRLADLPELVTMKTYTCTKL